MIPRSKGPQQVSVLHSFSFAFLPFDSLTGIAKLADANNAGIAKPRSYQLKLVCMTPF
jgi:hypothetical protein